MKPKTLGILAAAVGVLALFALLVDRDLPSTDEREAREKRIFRVEADEITGLAIEWDGAVVELERDPAPEAEDGEAPAFPPPREWRLTAPMTARADRSLADRLAGTLARLESERRLEGAARGEVGLEPPRGRVRWTSPSGEGVLEIGGDVPASSSLVAATGADADPVVIARGIVSDIERAPGDWRAKEVLPATREQIERIRLVPAGGGEEVVLARKGNGFAVERPYADAADPEIVDPLLTDLTSLRVESFLDAPLAPEAESALAGGPGRLELGLAARAEPYVVELGVELPDTERRYVRAGGLAFEAKTRLAEALAREPAAWRSRRWTSFESWKVERLRADGGEGPLELARADGEWKLDGETVPYTAVGDLLYALTSARAERVVPSGSAPGPPTLTVVLSDADGGEETLTLHPETAEGVPARVSGRDATLWLPATAAEEVRAKLAALRTVGEAADEAATEEGGEPAAAEEGSPAAGAEEEPPA